MTKKRSLLIEMGWTVFNRVRTRIAEDCGNRCTYCNAEVIVGRFGGRRLATIDHKLPLSRGGSWKRFNLTCACKRCNEIKGSMTAEEFLALPAYLREVEHLQELEDDAFRGGLSAEAYSAVTDMTKLRHMNGER